MGTGFISTKIIRSLSLPKANSRKRDNGQLLVVAGSHQYFGALLYVLKTASRLVDLIYLLTSKDNQKLVADLKRQTAEFMPVILVPKIKVAKKHGGINFDCVLIGPGLGQGAQTKKLVSQVLVAQKKAVLDADALNVLDDKLKRLLSPLHILTPHQREFRRLFDLKPSATNAAAMAKKFHCYIILKGPTDVIAQPSGKISLNHSGNAGMTKGGTGDVLAGLIAGLYCSNDAPTSAAAGAYINGAAGDALYKKVGKFYDAEDLVTQLPKTLHHLVKKYA